LILPLRSALGTTGINGIEQVCIVAAAILAGLPRQQGPESPASALRRSMESV